MIERSVPEFGNEVITHNVEFSLHPMRSSRQERIATVKPLTSAKILRAFPEVRIGQPIVGQLLDGSNRLRNACVIGETQGGRLVANIDEIGAAQCTITLSDLMLKPFAIFECKRVGIEQGMAKGPQTIEKAKQGAYVARTVSALQKVRRRDGSFNGIFERLDNKL